MGSPSSISVPAFGTSSRTSVTCAAGRAAAEPMLVLLIIISSPVWPHYPKGMCDTSTMEHVAAHTAGSSIYVSPVIPDRVQAPLHQLHPGHAPATPRPHKPAMLCPHLASAASVCDSLCRPHLSLRHHLAIAAHLVALGCGALHCSRRTPVILFGMEGIMLSETELEKGVIAHGELYRSDSLNL